jgi:hypothetical protein
MPNLLLWVYRVTWVVPLALYGLALGLLSMTPPDFTTSRSLVSVACIWLGAVGLIWEFKTEEEILVRLVIGLILGAVVFCVWPFTILYIADRDKITLQSKQNPAVTTAQIQELQHVTQLLGGKDEYQLRGLFDFEGYVKHGLLRAKQIIDPSKVPAAQAAELDRYYAGWIEAAMNPSLANITQLNGGTPRIEPRPGVPFVFILPRQYSLAKQQLLPFETSPQMPTDIQDAIKDFDKTLDDNAHLLIQVVNEKYSQDKNNILFDDDPNSPYLGATFNTYWSRFVPLKPKADTVLEAIRKFYGVK